MSRERTTSHRGRRVGGIGRLRNLFAYRELLVNLTRNELRLRYKNSVLGFLWSLLNPLLYLIVFSLVFQEILRAQIPQFAIFLLSGLLVWNFFSASLSGGANSVVSNASIVQKVWFPREVLPLASVGAAMTHFLLQACVLGIALIALEHRPDWRAMLLLPAALVAVTLLSAALALSLAVLNVHYRDTQHLLELVLLAWFWLTPVVYNHDLVATRLGSNAWVAMLNPLTTIALVFQRAIHAPPPGYIPDVSLWIYARNTGIVAAASLVLLVSSFRLFRHFDGDLAESI
jgi:ABC-2 type transport system permease protein